MSFEMPNISNISLSDIIPSFLGSSPSETSGGIDFFESVGEIFLPPMASVPLGLFRSWNFSDGERETRASQWVMPALAMGAMALLVANVALTKNPILKALEKRLEKPVSRLVVTSRNGNMTVFRLGFWGSDSYMARNLDSHILVTRGDRGILGRLSAWRMERAMTQHLRSSGTDLSTLGFGRNPINSHFAITGNVHELWKTLGFGQIS